MTKSIIAQRAPPYPSTLLETVILHVYLLEGGTPFFFPRPLVEKFGLLIDYGRKRIQFSDGGWTEVKQRNGQGHYLLNLAEDVASMKKKLRKPDFKFAPDGIDDNVLEVAEDPTETETKEVEEPPTENYKDLTPSDARHIYNSVDLELAKLERAMRTSRRTLETRRRKCWEVFVGKGLLSQELRKLGAETTSFGLENGWDLTDPHMQREFLDLIDKEQPDEIWLSPMCGPWSRLQTLNCSTPEARARLREKQQFSHDVVLSFVKRVFNKQVKANRYAHVEHPKNAGSWKTRNMRGLMAKYLVDFDMCVYGMNVDGTGFNKKPTRVATNKNNMAILQCVCVQATMYTCQSLDTDDREQQKITHRSWPTPLRS